jgi:hypothetical protein
MAPDTPEPEAPRPGTPRSEGDAPRPPRILVEVGDLEDPAEWDVILVENQEIDDETARQIAAQRAGRAKPPSKPRLGPRLPAGPSVSLPSLDERDVIKAFETDREAEDATEIDVDAFARPDDGTPLRPRQVAELPPEHDAFAGHPEPGDEPDEPEPVAEGPEPEPEPEAEEPVEPWTPAVREGPVLLDDPDDEFYAIGDAEVVVDAPSLDDDAPPTDEEVAFAPELPDEEATDDEDRDAAASDGTDDTGTDADTDTEIDGDAPDAPSDWDLSAVALDEERELLDDPDDAFYALGRNRIAAFRPVPGAPVVPLLPAPTARLSSDLWGTGGAAPPPPEEEVFEEEVEVDSSFPLGPDDLVIGGEVEPIALDELDYANVFGPVEGDLSIPDLDAPPTERRRRRAKPTYEDDLYVFEDDDRHWPVPEPRGGRRRELVALGLAAGIIVALGVGSQVFAKPDRQENTTEQSTTSTTRPRVRTTDTSTPDLTLPTLPADEPAVVGGVTVTTRPRTTTTVKGKPAPPTTAAPATTEAPTTTAAPTTTEPPPTTTEPPPTTTTLPDEGP